MYSGEIAPNANFPSRNADSMGYNTVACQIEEVANQFAKRKRLTGRLTKEHPDLARAAR
jgi:hypothetical protein